MGVSKIKEIITLQYNDLRNRLIKLLATLIPTGVRLINPILNIYYPID